MRSMGRNVLIRFLQYLVLSIVALIFLFPILYVVYTSLLPRQFIGQFVGFGHLTLDNYVELLGEYPIWAWYKNTAISTVVVVAGNVIIPPMAGYSLARLRFPGRKAAFICVLLSMMVPFQLVIIPQYIMLAKFKMVNTLSAITVPFLSQTIFIVISRQFFLGIPKELEEAARIDGLGRFGTYVRVVLPISGVLFVTIVIFNFAGTWNSYLIPSTYINTTSKYTLVVGLQTVNNSHFNRENLMLAGVFVLAFPVMFFFSFMQKYFIQGISRTGLKG